MYREQLATERKTVRTLQSDLRASAVQLDQLKKQLQAEGDKERERLLAVGVALKPVSIPAETHAGGAPGYPVTLWSDWHWGETVDIREMNGINAFNPEIAAAC